MAVKQIFRPHETLEASSVGVVWDPYEGTIWDPYEGTIWVPYEGAVRLHILSVDHGSQVDCCELEALEVLIWASPYP